VLNLDHQSLLFAVNRILSDNRALLPPAGGEVGPNPAS
jgi:hypothetical protein